MLQPLAIRHESQPLATPVALHAILDQLRILIEQARPVRFPLKAGEGWVFLDLRKVTHFEVGREVVHAWAGQKYRTPWTTLMEVEAAFPEEDFLRIQRHLLVRPDAIIGFRMTWGGRGEARFLGGVELEVSRGAVPKLKERLGLARTDHDQAKRRGMSTRPSL